MPHYCVHGFRTAECASCRICSHGFVTSRCAQCNAPRRVQSARFARASASGLLTETPEPITYSGFEIFYVPQVSGWRFRANADAPPSALSYRSVFLARKAIDAGETPKPAKQARSTSH